MSETQQVGRWRLHRGGVVNIWQYAVEVFDLSGGRAIFQGTNGSGKSRTLELLLPLCLDGDLHHIGSKGFDSVSMRRLMLDDYTGGPNRIGYAWIELQRDAKDGPGSLTCGVGVKASANSKQISDSWRFITEARVGVEVDLIPDGAPLGPTQLRDLLGPDCLFDDDQSFRARIADLVYGLPAARYPDLLHLQRTLRNPDVGLKVLAGELEQILSDSLPPLDPALVERLARSFDDLRSIRDNIAALADADKALSTFLSRYSGYALGTLRTLGQRFTDAERAVSTARTDLRKLIERRRAEAAAARELHDEVEQLDGREDTLERDIDRLKNSPAYDSVRDLADRKRAVESQRAAAISALKQAQAQRNHVDQLVDSAVTAVERLAEDTHTANALAADVGERMREAGLDPNLRPRVPAAPAASAAEATSTARISLEPETDPAEHVYRVPPVLDTDALADGYRLAADGARQAATMLGERAALARSLAQRARDLDTEHRQVEKLRNEAREAQIAATDAAAQRNEAKQDLESAAHGWRDAISHWATSGPLDHRQEPPLDLPEVAQLAADPDHSRHTTTQARAWMRSELPALRTVFDQAQRALADLDNQIGEANTELAALQSGRDPEPPLPPHARARRDPATGSAFYRLVDFAPDLDDQVRAGCEAALEASGLLNAWVTPDGTITDTAREDIHAGIAAPTDNAQPNLAEVLTPAVSPDSPVPVGVVQRLLQCVTLGDTDRAGLTVSTTGRWRAGVLGGAMTKPAAQYVGAGAREASRKRRIDELTTLLEQLGDERELASTTAEEAAGRVQAWDEHTDAFPPDADLVSAHTALKLTKATADATSKKAIALRESHSAAAERHQARQGELTRDARTAGLDDASDSLNSAQAAATQGRRDAEQLLTILTARCAAGVETVGTTLKQHEQTDRELGQADHEADAACHLFLEEKAAYDDRVSTIGGEAEALERQLANLANERTAIRQKLPRLRQKAQDAEVAAGKTSTLVDGADGKIAELVERERTAQDRFRSALVADGVWTAAVGDQAQLPAETTDAIPALASVTRAVSSEDAVMSALQSLQSALAGSHDVTVHRHGDVLTVTISGDRGRQPVAVAAHDVAQRLEEQRNLLSDEYQQIFDRFMLRDLADKLAAQVSVAEDLRRRMNDTLAVAQSSQGVRVELDWQSTPDLDDTMRQALQLVLKPFAKRSDDEDERLRRALTERIDAERDGTPGDYTDILGRALDYRAWHRFTVHVHDQGPDGEPRTRRMSKLSSGETRLVSYVTLFAAASAFYDAVSATAQRPPLRLVLLDEAFERLDDPTIARMLGLLVDLDMDWIITWPSGWGLSDKIPRMHIYDILRPKGGSGIARTHAIWSGGRLNDDADTQ